MTIDIGNKIKQLRTDKHITQEQLATYLGVTPQAISRWESSNGYPDIETLPRLAEFFLVSADELLGMNLSEREEKINFIRKEILRLAEVGSDDDNLNFARHAVAQFPSELNFQKNLADCICRKYMWSDLDRDIKMLEESEKIYTAIIESTRDDELKYETLQAMCGLYGYGFNDTQRANATANRIPCMMYCREDVRANMFRGENSIPYKQDYIKKLTDILGCEIQNLVLNGMSNEPEKWDLKIQMLETEIQLYKMIFGTDLKFYNGRLSNAYRIIATYLVAQGKLKETIDVLEAASDYAIAYDKAYANEHSTKYLSPFVDTIVYEEVDTHELSEHSLSYYTLERLTQDRYNSIRQDKRFKEIIENLSPYSR